MHIPANAHPWLGIPEVYARVRVTAFFPNGAAAARSTTVLLHPASPERPPRLTERACASYGQVVGGLTHVLSGAVALATGYGSL